MSKWVSGGFTLCRQLRPSSGREHVNASTNQWYDKWNRWPGNYDCLYTIPVLYLDSLCLWEIACLQVVCQPLPASILTVKWVSGGFTLCRQLMPSSRREHVNASTNQWYDKWNRWPGYYDCLHTVNAASKKSKFLLTCCIEIRWGDLCVCIWV